MNGILKFLAILFILDLIFINLFKIIILKIEYLSIINKKYSGRNEYIWYAIIVVLVMLVVNKYNLFDANYSLKNIVGYLSVSIITSLIITLFTLELD